MRLIGQAEMALEKMCKRAVVRVAFGRPVADQGVTRERIAEARIMIDSAQPLTLDAAWKMDTLGNKAARRRPRRGASRSDREAGARRAGSQKS